MPSDWITPADVADWLGSLGADDPRVVDSTAAVMAAVERRRQDLDFTAAELVPADVRLGAKMWAAVLAQQRSAPQGFDGYDAETALVQDGTNRAEILRLLGWKRPVVG